MEKVIQINPILLACIFALYVVLTLLLALSQNPNSILFLAWIGSFAASLSILVFWPVGAKEVLERNFTSILKPVLPNWYKYSLPVLVFVAVVTVGFEMGWRNETGTAAIIDIGIPVLSFVFGITYLSLIWTVATELLTVENKKKPHIHSTIGTFLLILYLPIGIFNVQSRLKRLVI